ncbi:hypothetical protein SKAU_G00233920 [Synaphobranchus kaupii]|uniref:HTH-like domain-containing protein n=1 Tax=Synaphobranchus kaupii TaxID=118154 RepID=A0A9Q1F680_SYNKA|nr:hypothetical protein SKAU_G00233920 [Synaphobranchus kaupii]
MKRVILTEEERMEVLIEAHAGHFGARRMQEKIRKIQHGCPSSDGRSEHTWSLLKWMLSSEHPQESSPTYSHLTHQSATLLDRVDV